MEPALRKERKGEPVFSPDGRYIVCGFPGDDKLGAWNSRSGRLVAAKAETEALRVMGFSPAGQHRIPGDGALPVGAHPAGHSSLGATTRNAARPATRHCRIAGSVARGGARDRHGRFPLEVLTEDEDRVVLTASPAELRQHLPPCVAEEKLFDGETEMRRIK